jgi:hypothetical protein
VRAELKTAQQLAGPNDARVKEELAKLEGKK